MGSFKPGEVASGPDQPDQRTVLFAGGLLVGAGLVDVLGGITSLTGDPYVDMVDGVLYQYDVTGWDWFHVVGGGVNAFVGMLVATGRRGTLLLGITVTVFGVIVDALLLPYQPYRVLLAAALNITGIRILLRRRRQLRAGKPT